MPIVINKNVRFDYLDIDDLSRITEEFIENTPSRRSYNICSGKVYDYQTIAEKVIEASGKDLQIITKEEGMKPEYSGTNTKLLKEFSDLEISPIDVSIKKLYDWYDSNRRIIKKELFEY